MTSALRKAVKRCAQPLTTFKKIAGLIQCRIWAHAKLGSVLLRCLDRHYQQKFEAEWGRYARVSPHFFSQQMGVFQFAFTERCNGPFPLYRGFFASEVIREGDRLLDIGCGDGFFAKRFFSSRCAHVDAIDIEPSAIATAQAENSAANIHYRQMDAVSQEFPCPPYQVIVWDGAIGHFPAETTHMMLNKIRSSLEPDGIFVGSESLGLEGSDHLQFFHSVNDLGAILKLHFPLVQMRHVRYQINSGIERHEAYWRCALKPDRMHDVSWVAVPNAACGLAIDSER